MITETKETIQEYLLPKNKIQKIKCYTFFSSSSDGIDVWSPIDLVHIRIWSKASNTRYLQEFFLNLHW